MIHSFATYEFLFKTLAFYASNKQLFDNILTKIDTRSKNDHQKTTTHKNTTTRTAEEEIFGYSDSDGSDDTDDATSEDQPLVETCVYVYDEEPAILGSSSEIYANL